MKPYAEDTIAAIATPLGVGGVGIVRLSGKDAVRVGDALFKAGSGASLARARSHLLLHGWIEQSGQPLDEALAVVMRAPHSYTREDVVELHCHGGTLVLGTVLELALQGGARLAQPGEFTLRAFLNGRLDLTQVEAVADVVRARSRLGLQVSANQLRGRLHDRIQALREDVAHVAALVAAGIDFPEEDVVFAHGQEIRERLERALEAVTELLHTAAQGRVLREGLAVAIVGKPNVGKSSLLNALLRESRAIVTDIPGTTRDTLEEATELGGLALRLIDTAGIRQTAEPVEQAGIARSRRAIAQADLVLLVLDGAGPWEAEDAAVLAEAPPAATLAVLNKADRMPAQAPAWAARLAGLPQVRISALTGAGLPDLEAWIRRWALKEERPQVESALITNLRQQQAAQGAQAALQAARRTLEEGRGEELLAVDLSRALDALGDIVGETTADDLLQRIFAEFCIGK
ncbi:MAG TPA: tRNA uridine-5-carboxymethylaminomethyl(34) synthesis GTPase MnmE [bacterium]|nr:tRNA uridine-5-carboxymethylaminomethyl(34) synthesis GTPase MnmE [bacterium]